MFASSENSRQMWQRVIRHSVSDTAWIWVATENMKRLPKLINFRTIDEHWYHQLQQAEYGDHWEYHERKLTHHCNTKLKFFRFYKLTLRVNMPSGIFIVLGTSTPNGDHLMFGWKVTKETPVHEDDQTWCAES